MSPTSSTKTACGGVSWGCLAAAYGGFTHAQAPAQQWQSLAGPCAAHWNACHADAWADAVLIRSSAEAACGTGTRGCRPAEEAGACRGACAAAADASPARPERGGGGGHLQLQPVRPPL